MRQITVVQRPLGPALRVEYRPSHDWLQVAIKSKSLKYFWSFSSSGRHSLGGVRTGFSAVNSSSKLLTSSAWR